MRVVKDKLIWRLNGDFEVSIRDLDSSAKDQQTFLCGFNITRNFVRQSVGF